MLLGQHEQFRAGVESICPSAALLSELPPDADVSVDLLQGAEFASTERVAPYYPIDYLTAMVQEATALRGMYPWC